MTDNRLDNFSDEEIQAMLEGADSSFSGWSKKSIIECNEMMCMFCEELLIESKKRRKILDDEIERTTPRCECWKHE